MEQKIVKEAFGEALKDSEKEKKEQIKKIILETLRKKVNLEEEVKKLQEKIKILAKDLEDFKQGRLDLIEERQKVDETARKTSVIQVERIIEEHHYYPRPWYEPFRLTYWHIENIGSNAVTMDVSSAGTSLSISDADNSFSAAGTDFHNFYSGSYDIGNKIINL